MELKNVTKSYRPFFLIGLIKSACEMGMENHDAEAYRKVLANIHLNILEFEELAEKEKEYNGIF